MRVETGLHDAMNYFNLAQMAAMARNREAQCQSSLANGQELLKDLRYFNQMAMSRQLGLKKELRPLTRDSCSAMAGPSNTF